jgi:hypothetical protein
MASKKKVAERQIQSLTRANLDLVRDLARVTAAAEVKAAPPPPAPPAPATPHDDEYRSLKETNPYAAAQYLLNHTGAILAERAAARGKR